MSNFGVANVTNIFQFMLTLEKQKIRLQSECSLLQNVDSPCGWWCKSIDGESDFDAFEIDISAGEHFNGGRRCALPCECMLRGIPCPAFSYGGVWFILFIVVRLYLDFGDITHRRGECQLLALYKRNTRPAKSTILICTSKGDLYPPLGIVGCYYPVFVIVWNPHPYIFTESLTPYNLIAFLLGFGDGIKLTYLFGILRIFSLIGGYCLCGYIDVGHDALKKWEFTKGTIHSIDCHHLQIRIFSCKGIATDADHRGWKIYHVDMAVIESPVADARHGVAKNDRNDVRPPPKSVANVEE